MEDRVLKDCARGSEEVRGDGCEGVRMAVAVVWRVCRNELVGLLLGVAALAGVRLVRIGLLFEYLGHRVRMDLNLNS